MTAADFRQTRRRSERRFGVWQGHLPEELHLRGIGTAEPANRILRQEFSAKLNWDSEPQLPGPAGRFRACEAGIWNGILALGSSARRIARNRGGNHLNGVHWQVEKGLGRSA